MHRKIQALAFGFSSLLMVAVQSSVAEDIDTVTLITQNLTSVCDKPQEAGSHWDIRVRGDGDAGLKLKFLKAPFVGVSGEVEFSKQEWTGIKNTVENSADYRECVKTLAPIFVDKFGSVVEQELTGTERNGNILGGIQWVDFNGGVELTLSRCSQKGELVACDLVANATDSDVDIQVYGSSAVFDQIGRKYNTSYARVANFAEDLSSARSYLAAELVHSIATPITLRFQGVSTDVSEISKVQVTATIASEAGKNTHYFDFRNVDINLEE